MKGFVTIRNDILESKEMLRHLDDEYRKANISEKDYKAMKEKYSNGNMSKKKMDYREVREATLPETRQKRGKNEQKHPA